MTIPNASFHGIPGAAIIDSDLNQDNVSAGLAGEQQLDRVLRQVNSLDKAHIFYSAKIPGRLFDADAMIASGQTVMIIDAKNWANNHHYKFTSTSDGATVVRRPIDQPNAPFQKFGGGDVHFAKQLTAWDKALPHSKVMGLLVIVGKNISVEGFPAFHIATISDLPSLLPSLLANDTAPQKTIETLEQWIWAPQAVKKTPSVWVFIRLLASILLMVGSLLTVPWCWPGSIAMLVVALIFFALRDKCLLAKAAILCSLIGALAPLIVPLI